MYWLAVLMGGKDWRENYVGWPCRPIETVPEEALHKLKADALNCLEEFPMGGIVLFRKWL